MADRRSVLIQDLCPGRRFVDGYNHIYMAADAVAYELALDALDHPGPADPARVPPSACLKPIYDGFDYAGFGLLLPELLNAPPGEKVGREPPLRCYLDPACELLRSPRLTPAAIRVGRDCPGPCRHPRTAILHTRAVDSGRLRLRLRRVSGSDRGPTITRGPFDLSSGGPSIRLGARGCHRRGAGVRCRRLAPGTYEVRLETQHLPDDPWTRERSLRLRVAAR